MDFIVEQSESGLGRCSYGKDTVQIYPCAVETSSLLDCSRWIKKLTTSPCHEPEQTPTISLHNHASKNVAYSAYSRGTCSRTIHPTRGFAKSLTV
jgi:hypothetical protein